MIRRLAEWLTTPVERRWAPQAVVWFLASQAFALGLALLQLRVALSREYVVQNDARSHVAWMERFLDPGLFPNDLIMDYFRSVAPWGYAAFYWLFAQVGLDPLLLNKLLPVALVLLTTGYAFGLSHRLFPIPFAGFVATVLLNQSFWLYGGLVNGTPRAFGPPLLVAFCYYLVGRQWIPCLVTIALQGLFYPQRVFIIAGILGLRLVTWERLSVNRRDLLPVASGLLVAALTLLSYALTSSEFGPAITEAQAKTVPSFDPAGRTRFFTDDPWAFWLCGGRTGFLPPEFCRWRITPPWYLAALGLPLLFRHRLRFPLADRVSSQGAILGQIVIVSTALFLAAHALLFRLYLPSRYASRTLWLPLALAAGMAVVIALGALLSWAARETRPRVALAAGITLLFGATLLLDPGFWRTLDSGHGNVIGEEPELYAFFARQPKDILVASLADEVDDLPPFSKRSILFGRAYATPYHVGYYRRLARRGIDLIRAQYGPSLAGVQDVIRTYGVDFWMLDREAFTPGYVLDNKAIREFPPSRTRLFRQLSAGQVPALARFLGPCSVFETPRLVVLEATCILNAAPE